MEIASNPRGQNVDEHEISRELAKPQELLAGMRDDEKLTLARNRRPIRHGAAIGFRRPEIRPLLGSPDIGKRRNTRRRECLRRQCAKSCSAEFGQEIPTRLELVGGGKSCWFG